MTNTPSAKLMKYSTQTTLNDFTDNNDNGDKQ